MSIKNFKDSVRAMADAQARHSPTQAAPSERDCYCGGWDDVHQPECPEAAAQSVSEQDERALPPLMEAFGTMENADDEGHTIGWVPGYTADQMRMYALAALAAHPAPQAAPEQGGRAELAEAYLADRHYMLGLRAGWNLGVANDNAGFNSALNARYTELQEARKELATVPAQVAHVDPANTSPERVQKSPGNEHVRAPAQVAQGEPVVSDKHLPGWERGIATITLSGHQLREALEFLNPDGDDDEDQRDNELIFGIVKHADDHGEMAVGMCCWNDDTDGVLPLDGHRAAPVVPSQPQQAEGGAS